MPKPQTAKTAHSIINLCSENCVLFGFCALKICAFRILYGQYLFLFLLADDFEFLIVLVHHFLQFIFT